MDDTLDKLRAGDSAAQAAFWAGHADDVRAVAAGILGRGPTANDIADAVLVDFLDVYVHRISSSRAVWSYLRLATARRAIRHQQRGRRHDTFEEESAADVSPAASDDQEQHAIDAELLERLDGCIDGLQPKVRRMVLLRFRRDWTNTKIGAALGVSKQYVGRMLTKSMGLLRTCLESHA